MAECGLVQYIEKLARPDGGYGWEDQYDSYLVPTFVAVGIYHLLDRMPPRRAELAEYIRSAHPIRSERTETRRHTGDPRLFLYSQIQGLLWLGEDVSAYKDEVAGFTHPQEYPRQYELNVNPILREQAYGMMCRRLLNIPPQGAEALVQYFLARERPNGTFNNTPASDGTDGNLLNTWWSLMALQDVREPSQVSPDLVPWLQKCQKPNGGFTYQPEPGPGWLDDALYTLAAVWSLNYLGAEPKDRAACVRYLLSLQNPDGGFANRPGEPSCPMATFYAAVALKVLGELDAVCKRPAASHAVAKPALPEGLKVFTVQFEAPGFGSPAEAVALAKALKIDLWGAKNSKPGWIETAQALANEQEVPVTFFQCNEEYGTHVGLPGLGYYTHVSDPMAPAGADMGASLAGQPTMWEEFRERRLKPLFAADGRMLWQICDNEEFSRILLDDTIERGGYAAISTFHFGCRNMAYTLPFVFRYRHLIPFIGLQDAHGLESWWWTDHLVGFRTLFLAEEPTWDGLTQALERQWVVAVRHDSETYYRTRFLGGAPGVQEFVQARQAEWQWWDDADPTKLLRPSFSLVAVKPTDEFEAARPEAGVTLRVRCQWLANHLAVLQKPLVELEALYLDGERLETQVFEHRDGRGRHMDHYYAATLSDPPAGKHGVQLDLRTVGGKQQVMQEVTI